MSDEGKHQDYKLCFDISCERAKVDLVKNIVAIANSGGGRIIFGRDEVRKPGIENSVVQMLDSARISDLVNRYISPAEIELAHETISISDTRYIHLIEVTAARYPVVMSRQGMWKGANTKTDRPLFLVGDVWTRHSSKTERITYQDLNSWIDEARRKEREALLEKITLMANLPEGSTVEIVSSSGEVIDNASRLIDNACRRREHDPNHLLSGNDLLWIYLQRSQLHLNEDELSIVIGSALRRPVTLYWWLTLVDDKPEIVSEELERVLEATDRDKSDAAKSVVELACIYASDGEIQRIIDLMTESHYAHFRKAAQTWTSRHDTLRNVMDRIKRTTIDKEKLTSMTTNELEVVGTQVAKEYSNHRSPGLSNKLSNINRAIWSRKSKLAYLLEHDG